MRCPWLYLARAKYELDRIPQIKEKLEGEWQKQGKLNDRSPLFIHMIAERQASIEGRMFFEARQRGQKPSPNIPKWAETELKTHRAENKTLAQKLRAQYSLSEEAAKECAKNAFRHQETHGSKPTDTQMTAMVQISHQVEDKYPDVLGREVGTHNLTYMRRMNADSMLRERCYENKSIIAMEHEIIKTQERSMLEVQKQRVVEQEISRQKDRGGFSMEM
ncbi:MAG: hypothetical protein KBD90_02460 [Alphaproteobacteria bacterium]|nr:hypothetical protein [Alphaproteobacteria bacterium]